MKDKMHKPGLKRREFLKFSAMGLGAAVLTGLGMPAIAGSRTLKIGYVSPQTGPLAAFADADGYVVKVMREQLRKGIKIGGKIYPVEIIVKDSQSNPNRAADVASELILSDEVDMMLVSSTPETTNPVADQCEVNEVPCISTVAPWQPWFFTRGGKPGEGFRFTYHFFWGLEDVIANYTALWDSVDTNKNVGGLFPNDGDGNAWGDKKLGFPPVLDKKGFSLLDPGRYQNLTDDFTAYIGDFKKSDIDVITGVMLPPDFTTFWTQARQQGFRPKVASIGKALLFPASVEALGDAGHNLSTEIWWTPTHPFKSSITGQSAGELADAFTKSTGKQWTQPLGFAHALFEVAVDVLQRTAEVGNAEAVVEAIKHTKLNSIVGNIDWSKGPINNVAKTPLVAGQWRLDGAHKYDLVVTTNTTAPQIPLGGKTELIG
ncbi:MAG: ABC transporter substrate-binding protein [Candidatus Thiodiazotropha endolucinida]|uniref:ABC transporter substrate-binding protein n=1 Tax=Candidatus Thiodiazotropha taylori TaxID=2792791 RepID=A0A9E4NMT6_9GAMM|nr:ABC transporter substrate-binding protein [Candidatus Thiodiazotropha taylori]MCW4238325.1 ABC transporter substrate-binding protein [Candidatus Thiodiazotropha endolucinida]